MSREILAFDNFELDVHDGVLRRAGVPVRTDVLGLRLLEALARKPGELVTKHELQTHVWNGRAVSENTLTVAIARLRKTLNDRDAPRVVMTVYGRGYRFTRPVETRLQPSAAMSAAPKASPLPGRERVLEHLRSALSKARCGSGGFVILTGEPGVGKTRVAELVACEATRLEVPVAWGYCGEFGHASPLWSFAALLRNLIGQSRIGRLLLRDVRFRALVPALSQLVPELAKRAEAPTSRADEIESKVGLASRDQIFDAVTRALILAAECTPYVVILDDLHRADTTTLELLHYLLPELSSTRVLSLATIGSDREVTALAQIVGHRNCTRIVLERLSEEEVASYVVATCGDADDAVCRVVFEKSEGLPLFMTNLMQRIGHVCGENAAARISRAALELAHESITRVDETTRQVLKSAALIGRRFSRFQLRAISGCDDGTLMTSLHAAVESHLIRSTGDQETVFVFTHELLREALFQTPARARRCRCDGHLRDPIR